jgi:hypothetical protein
MFSQSCYECLDTLAQKEVMSQLAQYAMFIVTEFGNIRAERDEKKMSCLSKMPRR